ncbi:hypothetical protein EVAR_48144_1 [Eumeta japonica]|uniref:Uncharacterized protein n=1 Tax=Eumeta variegata TaxID=151549 RepID=A0A4C1WS54_EUMVA|nr:hypothetical protein EVAR_48144_1 [Eumeta japonica]
MQSVDPTAEKANAEREAVRTFLYSVCMVYRHQSTVERLLNIRATTGWFFVEFGIQAPRFCAAEFIILFGTVEPPQLVRNSSAANEYKSHQKKGYHRRLRHPQPQGSH